MIEKIINSKFVTQHIDKIVKNPSYAAKFLIGATVAKDVFEYAISSVQTLNNKEIPKKKRKVVATMEAATGALSSISQLALGFGLANEKLQKRIGDFLFKDLIKAGEVKTVKKCRAGLAIASSVIFTTVIVKRILVPMIAAPIASYGTDFFSKRQKNKEKQV